MKDSDIIKALELCSGMNNSGCRECPLHSTFSANCIKKLMLKALDLINRQKAEIERFEELLDSSVSSERNTIDNIPYERAEAIKKFIAEFERRCIDGGIYPAFVKRQLEHVKEEMVGE